MAKKELGFVELEWVCPRCGSRNPGPQKTCTTCGGPQPQDVKFQQRERQQLLREVEAKTNAESAPDVHCAYCGTRNKADALVCNQCGADLTDARQRASGEVMGAYSAVSIPDQPCPNCGQLNSASQQRCTKCGAALGIQAAASPQPLPPPAAARLPVKISPLVIGLGMIGIIGILILSIVAASSLGRTETISGSVQATSWVTTLMIEEYRPVNLEGWESDIPVDASIGDCGYRFAYTASDPQPLSTEVCGTPYTVDQGNGFGQVVQDCVYETFARYCEYSVSQWVTVDQFSLQGSDLFPRLPNAPRAGNQRGGDSSALYTIQFLTARGPLEYPTTNLRLYQSAQPGTLWSLEINRSGEIISAQLLP
jgi:rubrerythrin